MKNIVIKNDYYLLRQNIIPDENEMLKRIIEYTSYKYQSISIKGK